MGPPEGVAVAELKPALHVSASRPCQTFEANSTSLKSRLSKIISCKHVFNTVSFGDAHLDETGENVIDLRAQGMIDRAK